MPPFHPLQNQFVARLQRKMQMRHQAIVICNHIQEVRIDLDRINR